MFFYFSGWPKRFDETIKRDKIETIVEPLEPWLNQLQISIKEALKPGSTDSNISIRIQVKPDDFEKLENVGLLQKRLKSRTIYKLRMRQDLERLLGVGWDYRVCNKEGDCFYVSTKTVRV